jgi:hypothetical protein
MEKGKNGGIQYILFSPFSNGVIAIIIPIMVMN